MLDLTQPRDVERFRKIPTRCDVLIENMRPGVMKRRGLVCSVSGYGQTGPLSQEGSHDLVIQALTGMMGRADRRRRALETGEFARRCDRLAAGAGARHSPDAGSIRRFAPLLGEHNDEVFREFGIND